MALLQSLGYFPVAGLYQPTLRYFREILADNSFLHSLGFSLYTALVSSALSVFLGLCLAWSIHRLGRRKETARSLFRIPVIVPHLVTVLLMYNILSGSGLLPRALFALGLLEDPAAFPALLYDRGGLGIILAYLWKEIPFVALVTGDLLGRVSDRLSAVARNLGASGWQAFRHVTLPILAPSLFSSFIIIFAFSFGAYEVPLLLGPTLPKTLPVQAYIEYSEPFLSNRPYAMAMNIIIAVITLFLTWLYFRSFQKVAQYGE